MCICLCTICLLTHLLCQKTDLLCIYINYQPECNHRSMVHYDFVKILKRGGSTKMWQFIPGLSPESESCNPSAPKTSMSSQFLLFYQCEKRRLAPGERCFNSAFCADYCMKGGEQTEEKQWMRVFLIHSARSNETSLVTAVHKHGIAWHRQIWQTLKQNTLDVCIHVGEEAVTHLQSVTKFLTFCLPGERNCSLFFGCKVVFLCLQPQ